MTAADPTAFRRFDDWPKTFAGNLAGQQWQVVYKPHGGPDQKGNVICVCPN